MMWDYGYGMSWMWIIGLLLLLVAIGAVVALVVLVMRGTGASGGNAGRGGVGPGGGAPPHDADPARRILEERLARGEITPEQFRESLRTLDEGREGRRL